MTFVDEVTNIIGGQLGFFNGELYMTIIGHFLIAFFSCLVVLVPLAVVWIILKWIVRLGRYDN